MTNQDLLTATLGYIQQAAPFMIVFTVVAVSGELIGLLKKASFGMFRRNDY